MMSSRITLKLATSLDGRIATATGESRWITGPAARAEVHKMREQADAVMIGGGSARLDNPSLLARTETPALRQPARIVVSATLDLPITGRLFEHVDISPLFVLTGEGAEFGRKHALERAGAKLVAVRSDGAGVDWAEALQLLETLGLKSILAEGGGALAASLLKARAVERLEWFRAPILLGADGTPCLGPLGLISLASAQNWRRVALRELGPDIWESYERA